MRKRMMPSLDCDSWSASSYGTQVGRTRNIISQSVNPPFSEPGTSYPSFPKYAIRRSTSTFSSALGWWNVCGTEQDGEGSERKERKSQDDMVI